MATTFEKTGGYLAGKDLRTFEFDHDLRLPLDYRDFLGCHNGGCPSPRACWVAGLDDYVLVDELYGIAREHGSDLRSWIKEYGHEMPEGSLVVGSDPGGAMFILGTTVEFSGIHLWDHQHRYTGSSEENGNTFFIAETFSTWIDSLRDLPTGSTGASHAGPGVPLKLPPPERPASMELSASLRTQSALLTYSGSVALIAGGVLVVLVNIQPFNNEKVAPFLFPSFVVWLLACLATATITGLVVPLAEESDLASARSLRCRGLWLLAPHFLCIGFFVVGFILWCSEMSGWGGH